MKRYLQLDTVLIKSSNKKYFVLLDKKNVEFLLKDAETGDLVELKPAAESKLRSKYKKEYKKYLYIYTRKTAIMLSIKLYFSAYAITLGIQNRQILREMPEILKNYTFSDEISDEQVKKDLLHFLDKNQYLTEEQKEYLYDALEMYLCDHIEELSLNDVVNAYKQISKVSIEFGDGPIKKNGVTKLGEYKSNQSKIIIYENSSGTMLHEAIHCIVDRKGDYFGLSLEEGYAGSIESEYSERCPYRVQNEHLYIISRIIGTEELKTYLSSSDFYGLCNKIAKTTGTNENYIKQLIEDMDTFSSLEKDGTKDEELLNSINERLYELVEKTKIEDISNRFIYDNLLTREYKLITGFYLDNKVYMSKYYNNPEYRENSTNPLLLIVNNNDQEKSINDIARTTARYLILEDCQKYYEEKNPLNYEYPQLELLLNLTDQKTKENLTPGKAADTIMASMNTYLTDEETNNLICDLYSNYKHMAYDYFKSLIKKYRKYGITMEDWADINSSFNVYRSVLNVEQKLAFYEEAYEYSFSEENITGLMASNLEWTKRNLLNYEESFYREYEEISFSQLQDIKVLKDNGLYYIYCDAPIGSTGRIFYGKRSDEPIDPSIELCEYEPLIDNFEKNILVINGVEKEVFIFEISPHNHKEIYEYPSLEINYAEYMRENAQILKKNKDID